MKVIVLFGFIFFHLVFPTVTDVGKSFNRVRTFDVLHYKMGLHFDAPRKTVFGDSTITLRPLDGPLSTIELDAKDITFNSITNVATAEKIPYNYDKRKLLLNLKEPLTGNSEISIRFTYSAKPKKGIYFVPATRARGKIISAAQIWTQGEAEETHHWLPSYDFPDDKATTEQIITVAAGETVIGNGQLVSNKLESNNTRTFHFKMPVPHSIYLSSFVVGKYLKVEDKYKNVPLGYYVYPGNRSLVQKAFGQTKDMMRVFEELTGHDYPFPKYDQVVVARFQFGGMENITATTLADSEISLAGTEYGREVVQDLVAHELAHSWFGNLVTCRNWAELWINESFASFMEAAYREKVFGRANYLEKIEEDAGQYFAYASASDDSKHGLFNTTADPENDDTMFDAVTYNKGSAIIHTLREELGNEVFWKGINLYITRFARKNVETPDVKAVFEEVSGRDLDWFFDQWVYRAGHPDIGIRQSFNQSTGELVLEFVQNAAKSNDPLDLYRLPLDIEIKTSQGVINEKFVLENRSQKVTILTKAAPELITIDKDYKIPIKDINMSKLITIK